VRFLSIDYLGQIICRLRTPPVEAADTTTTVAVTPTTVLDDLSALLDATDAIAVDLLDKTRTTAAALVRRAIRPHTHAPVLTPSWCPP
jgi:hypothetical protein